MTTIRILIGNCTGSKVICPNWIGHLLIPYNYVRHLRQLGPLKANRIVCRSAGRWAGQPLELLLGLQISRLTIPTSGRPSSQDIVCVVAPQLKLLPPSSAASNNPSPKRAKFVFVSQIEHSNRIVLCMPQYHNWIAKCRPWIWMQNKSSNSIIGLYLVGLVQNLDGAGLVGS